MDRELRGAERSGDPVALLRARLRAGELTEAHVALAARLGHTAARGIVSDETLVDWADAYQRRQAIEASRELLGDTLPVRVAADWAERALPAWENSGLGGNHPHNKRPREAIAAAKAWAACPCEKHRLEAERAYEAVVSDAHAQTAIDIVVPTDEYGDVCTDTNGVVLGADFAPHKYLDDILPVAYAAVAALAAAAAAAAAAAFAAALATATAADDDPACNDAYSTDSAFDESAYDDANEGALAFPTAFAAYRQAAEQGAVAAARASHAARVPRTAVTVAPDPEYEWQRLRLAAYVLGEVG